MCGLICSERDRRRTARGNFRIGYSCSKRNKQFFDLLFTHRLNLVNFKLRPPTLFTSRKMTRSLPSVTPTALPPYHPTIPLPKTHPNSKCYRLMHKGFSHVSVSVSVPRVPLPAKFSSRPSTFLLFPSLELQSYAAYGAAIARAFWMFVTDSQINVCLSVCPVISFFCLISYLLFLVLRSGLL